MRIEYKNLKKGTICIMTYLILIFFLTISNIPFSLYYAAAAGVGLFIFFMEAEWKGKSRFTEEELVQLEWLLSEVRHRYYVHGMVDEAIREAIDHCPYEHIRKEAEKIYEVLVATDTKTAKAIYQENQNNRFYNMFLTLSLMVSEFGDQRIDGESLYLGNIKNLRNEIHIEIQSKRATRHHFSGLTFLILLPMFCVKLIEGWGVSNLPELEDFYKSNYGSIFYVVLFSVTIFLYYLFYILKTPFTLELKEHKLLERMMRIEFLKAIIQNFSERFYYQTRKTEKLLKGVGESMSPEMFLLKRLLCSAGAFATFLVYSFYLSKSHYSAFSLLAVMFLSILVSYVPYWILIYRTKVMQMCMEDEVLQFHSILLMLMYMEQVSAFELLEAMEEFSVIFKSSLRECIYEYESGQMEALEHLKEKENCVPFQKLVDNLIMCDQIGVIKALDEIALERNFYREKKKAAE